MKHCLSSPLSTVHQPMNADVTTLRVLTAPHSLKRAVITVKVLKYLHNFILQCKQFVTYPNQATPLSLPSYTKVSILFEITTFPGGSKTIEKYRKAM